MHGLFIPTFVCFSIPLIVIILIRIKFGGDRLAPGCYVNKVQVNRVKAIHLLKKEIRN